MWCSRVYFDYIVYNIRLRILCYYVCLFYVSIILSLLFLLKIAKSSEFRNYRVLRVMCYFVPFMRFGSVLFQSTLIT